MERILRYLCEQETDSTGEAWTLISRITAELAFTREEVYTELMKVEDEGLMKMIKTIEPGPYALVSVTITDQGRLCSIYQSGRYSYVLSDTPTKKYCKDT